MNRSKSNSQSEEFQGSGSPWRDSDLLEELYHKRGLSTIEIGNKLGCDGGTIHYWLKKHDLETRSYSESGKGKGRVEYAHFYTTKDGYEMWRANTGEDQKALSVHRLVAVSEYGFDAVADKEVHHKNKIPWDNRPENLVPLTTGEHGTAHSQWYAGGFDEC